MRTGLCPTQIYGGRTRIVLRDGTVLSEQDSLRVGDALAAFATQPGLGCSMPWAPNKLVIWDNQCCMHAVAPYDVENQSREMWRLTIGEDEVPLASDVQTAAAAARL
eukprot:SAG22_NODE_134_length_18372_cov_33.054944_13_plen_107_part_00